MLENIFTVTTSTAMAISATTIIANTIIMVFLDIVCQSGSGDRFDLAEL